MLVRAHVFVSGRVQGVFFRQSAREKAMSLNIKGWVRNVDDGRVEAVFEGEDEDVKAIVKWCRKGPGTADVDDIEVVFDEKPHGENGFSIRG